MGVGRTVRALVQQATPAGLAVAIGGLAAAGSGGICQPWPPTPTRRAVPLLPKSLDVLPFPGTPDAAPKTNIDFPAVSLAQVGSVTAVGSRSGLHAGRLSAQPAGHGTAFTPDRPFSAGRTRHGHRDVPIGPRPARPRERPAQSRSAISFSVARPGSIAGRRARREPGRPPRDEERPAAHAHLRHRTPASPLRS